MVVPDQSSGSGRMPPDSPGKSRAVWSARPNLARYSSMRFLPSCWPIMIVPTFDDSAMISSTDQ